MSKRVPVDELGKSHKVVEQAFAKVNVTLSEYQNAMTLLIKETKKLEENIALVSKVKYEEGVEYGKSLAGHTPEPRVKELEAELIKVLAFLRSPVSRIGSARERFATALQSTVGSTRPKQEVQI